MPIVYVGIAAVRSSGGGAFSIAALVALPFCVTLAFRFTDPKTVGEDLVGDGPRTAIRVAVLGASLYVAARTSAVGRAAFDAIAAAGVGTATTAALYGLARVPETRSLLAPPSSTSRLDGVFAMVLAAAIATTVPAVAALSPTRGGAIDPLTIDYALVAESACALVLLTAASLRFRVGRRLELGAADRGVAALAVAGTALCVAAPAAALGFAAPDRILPAAALLASLAVATVLVVSDARLVGRALRTLLVVCILASPIALLTAGMAAAAPRQSGGVVLGASVVLVLVGVLGHRIAARMRPESARWLAALERAQESAAIPEPYSALRGTLFALREQLGPSAPSPVLFRTEAGDTLTVDRAGYLHEAKGAAPPTVFGFCDAEPEHTFRIEVARALEVTRPDVRPTLAWMEAHDFAAVTSLRDDDGPVGLLAMPRSGRRAPLTLEEVLALSRLTERMSAVFSLASSLANARTRQLEAEEAEKRALARASALAREIAREDERWAAQARRAARRSPAARYSPAARLAEAEMARVAGDARPLVLLCPPGVAADGFAALHHLGGPRKNGPFIVADGADAREHGIALWTDDTTSPLWLARGGTLVVLDVAALPPDVQSLLAGVARAQEVPRVEGSAPPTHDVALVLTVRETVDVLYARGRMVEELADALGDRAVPLPPLAARPEDVRAIALDHLARLGNALRGSPLGLADDALARLFEEPFPGNDEELAALLLRAAVRAKGAVVTAADLGGKRDAAGDGPVEESAVFRARASSRPPRRRLRPALLHRAHSSATTRLAPCLRPPSPTRPCWSSARGCPGCRQRST